MKRTQIFVVELTEVEKDLIVAAIDNLWHQNIKSPDIRVLLPLADLLAPVKEPRI